MQNFCFSDVGQALKTLGTSREGLSDNEAASRLKTYGANAIEKGRRAGVIKLFFSQFKDFMTVLLIIAAAVSAVIAFISKDKNDLTDTFIILAIIFINALVGTIQQYRADKAIENLKKLSACSVKV
ncbi:MAG: ATPase, partial [Clostridia bacterium]|nr:ATPase [Clostridia bacterium]